jgi:hypothetical protein
MITAGTHLAVISLVGRLVSAGRDRVVLVGDVGQGRFRLPSGRYVGVTRAIHASFAESNLH